MPEHDLERTVAAATPPLSLEALLIGVQASAEECVKFMKGWTDPDGTVHDGMLRRMGTVEKALEDMAAERKALEAQRLTWKTGLSLATAGALMGQAFTYLREHIK